MARAAGGAATPASPASIQRCSMHVTVKLFATFRRNRFDAARREYPAGTTLADIVDALGIARHEIGVLLVRGRHAELEHPAAHDDTISIFPLLGGG
jgi:molybdopterin converting factor small subunit